MSADETTPGEAMVTPGYEITPGCPSETIATPTPGGPTTATGE